MAGGFAILGTIMRQNGRDYTPGLLSLSIALHLGFVILTAYLLAPSPWALVYVVAYPLVFLYINVWFACAGCPKYGRTCVMIPFGGRLAATFFSPRPHPPARLDKVLSLTLTLSLTLVCLPLSALQQRWELFGVGLVLNLCQLGLLKATVAQVFDGWGKF